MTKITIDENLYKNTYKEYNPNFKISEKELNKLSDFYEKEIKKIIEK